MPGIPGKIPRPRFDHRALAERWQEKVDQLRELSPGAQLPVPINESTFDLLCDLVAEQRKAHEPPPPDEETRAARAEYFEVRRQYNAVVTEIRDAQAWLALVRHSWKFKSLITPDCFHVPAAFDTDVDQAPTFTKPWEARAAAQKLQAQLQWVRDTIHAPIVRAQQFEKKPAAEQTLELMRMFITRETENNARIASLESQCAALEARLGRLERGTKKSKLRRVA
jgi:hypothetical protein